MLYTHTHTHTPSSKLDESRPLRHVVWLMDLIWKHTSLFPRTKVMSEPRLASLWPKLAAYLRVVEADKCTWLVNQVAGAEDSHGGIGLNEQAIVRPVCSRLEWNKWEARLASLQPDYITHLCAAQLKIKREDQLWWGAVKPRRYRWQTNPNKGRLLHGPWVHVLVTLCVVGVLRFAFVCLLSL